MRAAPPPFRFPRSPSPRCRPRLRDTGCAGLALLAVLALPVPAAPAGEHVLGAGDRVAVSVLSRPELSRDYRVRLDGSISMHVIGSVPAAGRTAAELEALLETRLGEVFEGATSTTVEVAEYRPVIVGGHVSEPGQYPFRAGLDVAGALALAGGPYRLADEGGVNAEMRVEERVARHALLRARLASSLIERERLRAERDGTDGIALPDEAVAIIGDAAAELADAQASLRSARAERLSLQIADGTSAAALASDEATAYAERQDLIRRQLDATLAELANQEDLSERGLARAQRLLDLRLSADRYRADELEAVALEAGARRQMSEAEAQINAARLARDGSIAERLATLDAEILEIRTEIDQSRRFVNMFSAATLTGEPLDAGLAFTIRRRGPDGLTVLSARPDTELAPGDMVEVLLFDPAQASGLR